MRELVLSGGKLRVCFMPVILKQGRLNIFQKKSGPTRPSEVFCFIPWGYGMIDVIAYMEQQRKKVKKIEKENCGKSGAIVCGATQHTRRLLVHVSRIHRSSVPKVNPILGEMGGILSACYEKRE